MTKLILTIIASLTITTATFGQTITYDDFKEVIPFLQQEDFKGAYKKTNILCFEYFDFSEPVNSSEMIGKNVRCGGTLSAIETNPNKSKIWIARLRISKAFARVMTPR